MTRWYRDFLAKRVKCFPPAVTNKWRPADTECKARQSESFHTPYLKYQSLQCRWISYKEIEREKKEYYRTKSGLRRRHWKSPKEINTETLKKKNGSPFLCDLGEKTSTSFPHLLLEEELPREANFPCLTCQEDTIPTLSADRHVTRFTAV